jgi:hypothetical protein
VPEFHLAQFIPPELRSARRIQSYDKVSGYFRTAAVARSASSPLYYELPGETAEERARVEVEFSQIENEIAPFMVWLAKQQVGRVVFDESYRDALAGYMAILHVRVPAVRASALRRAERMARDPARMGLTDSVRFRDELRKMAWDAAGDDEEIEATRVAWLADVRAGRRRITVHKAASLIALTPAVEKVRPRLVQRHWEFLRVNGWVRFVMGDQPVTLFSKGRIAPEIGFDAADVQVLMPISSSMLLLISNRPRESALEVKREPWQIGLRQPWWAFANRIAWLGSKRYVYGSKRHDLQATQLMVHPDDRRRDIYSAADDELDAASG